MCSACGEEKPREEFYKDKRRKDGLHSRCKVCHLKAVRRWQREHPEKVVAAVRKWQASHEEQYSEARRLYRAKNREKISEEYKHWREANPNYHRKWAQDNRTKRRASCAKYKATKLQATPQWADLDAIQQVYAMCPDGWHVDHIVPLQGQYVCGLHVAENLQHLPAPENIRKGNRFIH